MGKSKNITGITTILLLAFSLLASSTLLAVLLAVGLPASVAEAKPASVQLQEGLYAEEIEGDLDAAIKIYEQIAADKSADARYAAQAMYRLGVCYQKKQDYQEAKATFEKLIARFPKEKSIIEKVQPLLDQMSTQDPAALMPAETLVYLEIGSPGKQIETILNMLKGTPFENPLATLGVGPQSGGGKSPGDMMAALLNPSMITEFKKIRGVALGFQAIQSNNPPLVAVIYPGESDALRGILLAGLGMVLQPGEAVEGMQTLRMDVQGGAAYDDNVIILASPIDRLTWCVKQYKGITNEPTLVSQNKAFQKLSRKIREQNAYTIWADVDRIFPMLKEEMPDEQRRLIESIGDIGNVDEFTACLSLEKDGIAVETNIGFKDGHNCLAYNLIRTPNISKAGFEAVPPEAVAVVSFALSESEGGGVAGARKALKKLTGLDIGRELFANIEQVTLFALPPTPTSNKHILAKNISPIVPCLGLAITSHNAKRTHRLFTQLLTIANLAMNLSMGEESDQQTTPTSGKYRIGTFDDKPAYCYMGQVGKSTIIGLSPEVLQASLSAVKSGKSALSTGPLHEILSQLPSDASKLVAVNAGGAVRLADVHLCKSLGVSPDPDRNYLSQLLGRLAEACDKTYVQVRTDEQPNNFNLKVNMSNLPQVGPIFPVLVQIPQAMENPMLAATRPRPADKAMVKPATAVELNWAPGRDATAHRIYFGTNADELPRLAEVKTPSYPKLPRVQKGITYYWRIDEVQANGSVVTGDIWSFSTGKLVAWWKFDETSSNTAEDSSGNNYHGTAVHGNPVWKADGKFGGCLDFNERYGISIPRGVFSSVNKAITISVWLNGDENQANHSNVILQAGVGRKGKPYLVTVETEWKENGALAFKTGRGEAEQLSYNAALDEWAGRWNHYAFVKDADAGFQRIYLNGRLVAEQTGTTATMTGVGATRIGIAPDRFGDQYIGKLDDLRIYNYALSTEEIQQLCGIAPDLGPVVEPIEPRPPAPQAPSYLKGLVGHWKFDEGSGMRAYDSEGNNHGTIHGAQWTDGWVNGALYFDSRDDYVSISPVTLSKNWTVSAWCEPLRNEVGGCNPIMGGPGDYENYIILCEAKNHINLETDTDGDWVIVGKGVVDFNEWAHYTVTRNGNTISAYKNGVFIDNATLPTGDENTITKIGSGYGAATYYKGRIDDVRIYDRALSEEEIGALYRSAIGSAPDERAPGFGPVIERTLGDHTQPHPVNSCIDFDSSQLFTVRHEIVGKPKEVWQWVRGSGIDAFGETDESPMGWIGLRGLDMVALPVDASQWDFITPEAIRQQVSLGKAATQDMILPKDSPGTYIFKTREGGMGILQILEVKYVEYTKIRYKMLQERIRPEVEVAPRQVFLPDADTPGANAILDLASGELLPAGTGKEQLTVFREMGKGDLAYDRVLICLRGGKAKLLQAGKLTNLKIKGQIEDSTAYKLPKTPCRLVVTTAEGDAYEVKVLSVEGDKAGIHIEYWKSAEAPTEFAIPTPVQPDVAKAVELGEALPGLFQGVFEAIENDDPNTALMLVDMVIEHGREFEQLVRGTDAEASVRSGFEVLTQLRDALENKEIDRAKILLINVLGQIGPAIEATLKKTQKYQQAQQKHQRHESRMRLHILGIAVVTYADEHNGMLPNTLQELKPYIEHDFQWLVDNVEYLGKGKSTADAPDTVIAYDKTLLEKGQGTNVLFLDAHVEFLKAERLERLGIIAIAIGGETEVRREK